MTEMNMEGLQFQPSHLLTDTHGQPWVLLVKDFLMARRWETAWEEEEIDQWVNELKIHGIRTMQVLHYLEEIDWSLIAIPAVTKRILRASVSMETQLKTPILGLPGLTVRRDVLEPPGNSELFEGFQRMNRASTVADYMHIINEVARAKQEFPNYPLGTEFYQRVGTSQPTYSKATSMIKQLKELASNSDCSAELQRILDNPYQCTLAEANKIIRGCRERDIGGVNDAKRKRLNEDIRDRSLGGLDRLNIGVGGFENENVDVNVDDNGVDGVDNNGSVQTS